MTRVRGLGESDDDDESASAWVTKSRQLQKEKEMASKRVSEDTFYDDIRSPGMPFFCSSLMRCN